MFVYRWCLWKPGGNLLTAVGTTATCKIIVHKYHWLNGSLPSHNSLAEQVTWGWEGISITWTLNQPHCLSKGCALAELHSTGLDGGIARENWWAPWRSWADETTMVSSLALKPENLLLQRWLFQHRIKRLMDKICHSFFLKFLQRPGLWYGLGTPVCSRNGRSSSHGKLNCFPCLGPLTYCCLWKSE